MKNQRSVVEFSCACRLTIYSIYGKSQLIIRGRGSTSSQCIRTCAWTYPELEFGESHNPELDFGGPWPSGPPWTCKNFIYNFFSEVLVIKWLARNVVVIVVI